MFGSMKRVWFLSLLAILLPLFSPAAYAQSAVTTHTGSFPDGATYLIEIPANWNGTLFLYSHGYVIPGNSNPALDVGDPLTRAFLLDGGFALAGSSYATWNTALDFAFAFKTLIAPGSGLQLVDITDPVGNLTLAEQMLALAQATPQGRARLALAAALADGPGWFVATSPEPTSTDYAAQEFNQFLWASTTDFPFFFAFRAELESRARGNPSWNAGVHYRSLLARSIDRNEVVALYQQAGLDLDADLEALQVQTRISADPEAVHYLESNIVFDGQIHIPVLTMHTKGDGLVLVQNESAYRNVVTEAGNSAFLRQTFVDRAGHCAFTPAETITAVQSLLTRLDTGTWGPLDATTMNAAAFALGPGSNVVILLPPSGSLPGTPPIIAPTPPAYFDFTPSPFLRPFDALFRHVGGTEKHGSSDPPLDSAMEDRRD